jgi:triosephosphate isomerase
MKKIIAGNWKMNGDAAALDAMLDALESVRTENKVIIFPPFTLLGRCRRGPEVGVKFGAQDCSAHESGAFTGEISASMIAATGAGYVMAGHSERRMNHAETSGLVAKKAAAAVSHGLTPVICVGETLQDKENGRALETIEIQTRESTQGIDEFILAYEPVWAIGTGLTPTADDIAEIHSHIRKILKAAGKHSNPVLYGGSVKGSNAAEIMSVPHVGGVLVGGASLKPEDFAPIITASEPKTGK